MVIWCCPRPIWQKETWFFQYKNRLMKWNTTKEYLIGDRTSVRVIWICKVFLESKSSSKRIIYLKFKIQDKRLSICTILLSLDLIEPYFILCILWIELFNPTLLSNDSLIICAFSHCRMTQRHWYMNSFLCILNFNAYVCIYIYCLIILYYVLYTYVYLSVCKC